MLRENQEFASIDSACGLAEEVVRTFGAVRLRVFGTSMAPAILPGDLVSIERATLHEISPGDVVLFHQRGRFFVHRVVDRKEAAVAVTSDEGCLITRGDRLRQDDPPVNPSELLGRVVSLERNQRKMDVPSPESNRWIVRLLRSSDRLTYLYVRFFVRLSDDRRGLFLRRAKCQS
jgi:signal peptidase I